MIKPEGMISVRSIDGKMIGSLIQQSRVELEHSTPDTEEILLLISLLGRHTIMLK